MKTLLLFAASVSCFALTPDQEIVVKETAHEYIKDHLKAPATAVFSKESVCAPLGKPDAEEVAGLGPTPECATVKADNVGDGVDSVMYRTSVDAQNSYGALIRTKFFLHIFYVNGKWSIHDEMELTKLLKSSCLERSESARIVHIGDWMAIRKECNSKYPGVDPK